MDKLRTFVASRRPSLDVGDARGLRRAIVRRLSNAYENGQLLNPLHEIEALVRVSVDGDHTAITGGVLNFDRDPAKPHFSRTDGSWFDFHLVVGGRRSVDMVSYGFELRFAARGQQQFVRVDLNPEGHANDETEDRAGRSHLHASTDDWSLPYPILSPMEALELMLASAPAGDRKARS